MQNEGYIVYRICTNVRDYLDWILTKIKPVIIVKSRIRDEYDKNKPLASKTEQKVKESLADPLLNPFQSESPRTDFLVQWINQVNLDIFEDLF